MAPEPINVLPSADNIAVVLHEKKDLRVEQWPLPDKILPDECLIKTSCCGICGTDIHLWQEGRSSHFVVSGQPFVIGHESSATVVQVGSDVKHLKPGDKVAVEPAISCLKCEFCRDGRYNLCPKSPGWSRGMPGFDGCLRRYYTHPAAFLHKLPNNMSLVEGAMCEPLSIVVHACRRLNIRVGQNVLVCGAGTMGMLSMLTAKAFGANKVAITDVDAKKLKLAKELGATETYLIDPKNFDPAKLAEKIQKDLNCAPEVSIECTGVGSSTSLAILTTKYGGRVGQIGLGRPFESVPMIAVSMREIDIIGVCRFKDDFPLVIHLIESGKVNVKPLCTKQWQVENALDAFEAMKNGTTGNIKTIIKFE